MSYEHILTHHGIKGQEWGERNGPPYPLNKKEHDKVIKKAQKEIKKTQKKAKKGLRNENLKEEQTIPAGTKLYRTTINQNEDLSGYKYVSYVDEDRNYYKGQIGKLQSTLNDKKDYDTYENEYSLSEDLRIPSRKKLFEVGRDLLLNDSEFRNDVVEQSLVNTYGNILGQFGKSYSEIKKYAKQTGYSSFEDDFAKSKKARLNSILDTPIDVLYGNIAVSYVKRNGVRNKMFGELKKQGYNAIMDEEDISIGARHKIAPMIIFDGSTSMTLVSQTKLSSDEVSKSAQAGSEWDRKQKQKNWNKQNQWSDSEKNHILG